MRDRWAYRDVEGVLYRLGGAPEGRPAQSSLRGPMSNFPGPRAPSAPYLDQRVDVALAAQRALDADEIQEVREHYLLGIKRHTYGRRSRIIKKLLTHLNDSMGE